MVKNSVFRTEIWWLMLHLDLPSPSFLSRIFIMGGRTWGPPRGIVHGLRALFSPRVFVETGTFLGETAAWAAAHFDQVYTIEAAAELHAESSRRHARLGNVKFLHGESQARLAEVVAELDQPALFWLDAHWSCGPTWGQDNECPLLQELAIIASSPHEHLIMIDDARLFLAPPPAPHCPAQWPDIGQVFAALAVARKGPMAILEDVIVAVPDGRGGEFASFLQNYLRRNPLALSSQALPASTFSPLDIASQFRRHKIQPRGVVHIGAHHGQELPIYLKMGFERVLLVEANPAVFAGLKERTASVMSAWKGATRCKVRLACFAVSDTNGEVEFRVNSNSESSSLLPLKGHLDLFPKMVEVDRIRVASRTLDTLMAEAGTIPGSFNFLNIDVQGAELLVLSDAENTLSHIDAVCAEINFSELYQGCALAWELDALLHRHGFERVATHHRILQQLKTYRLEWGDAFYVKTIKVSAIVSTYDSAALFVGRMENLIGQTLFARGRMEIIVIDSASPGNEGGLVQPFLARYPGRIRYLRTPERETNSAAWNRAIEQARGEYITTQNVDDRMKRDGIRRLADYLDGHPECVLVHADQEKTLRGSGVDVEALARPHWNRDPFIPELLLFATQVGSQPMWRASAHDLCGFFDPSFAALGDREFYLRLCSVGEFHHLPEVLGSVDFADGSVSRGGGRATREAQRIEESYRDCGSLARLLGYRISETGPDNDSLRQVLINNLCCTIINKNEAYCGELGRALLQVEKFLASAEELPHCRSIVQANRERLRRIASLPEGSSLAGLGLEWVDWPPGSVLLPV